MNKIITEIEKNKTEVIRVELTGFSDYDLVGLRVYVNRESEDPLPTKKGIASNLKLLPELKSAINDGRASSHPGGIDRWIRKHPSVTTGKRFGGRQ